MILGTKNQFIVVWLEICAMVTGGTTCIRVPTTFYLFSSRHFNLNSGGLIREHHSLVIGKALCKFWLANGDDLITMMSYSGWSRCQEAWCWVNEILFFGGGMHSFECYFICPRTSVFWASHAWIVLSVDSSYCDILSIPAFRSSIQPRFDVARRLRGKVLFRREFIWKDARCHVIAYVSMRARLLPSSVDITF